ncbi:hypothetical protein [Rummeliibacillus pycnus]|uniref:hypothetical protein n=1 Tax=Rummeliibacillus pycnus TaxID=101070 RepID=UPI003D27B8B1
MNIGEGKIIRKKNLIIMIVAFTIEAITTYSIASLFSIRFIEIMFFAGLIFALGILFFTSSGGSISGFQSSQVSAQTGIIQKRESFVFKRGPIFNASVIFCLIGLVFFILLIYGVIPPVKN